MSQEDLEKDNELEFLRWYFHNADFGPGSCDVRVYLYEQYEKEGGEVPDEYDFRRD